MPRRKRGMNDYSAFSSRKSRSKNLEVKCMFCEKYLRLSEYDAHCDKDHGINYKENCVYCGERLPFGTIKLNSGHLKTCLENFLQTRRKTVLERPQPPESNPPATVNLSCTECQKFYEMPVQLRLCERRPDWSDTAKRRFGGFYDVEKYIIGSDVADWIRVEERGVLLRKKREGELVAEIVDPLLNRLHLDDELREGLEWMRRYWRHYRHEESGITFFHVMVRAGIYGRFEAVFTSSDNLRVLPFTCLCDGSSKKWSTKVSNEQKWLHAYHRHLIVVARYGSSFKSDVRRALDGTETFFERDDKRYMIYRIGNPMHFLNVMAYVSRNNGQCHGFEGGAAVAAGCRVDDNDPANLPWLKEGRHHNLWRPWSPHAHYRLSIFFPGILKDMVRYRKWTVGSYSSKMRIDRHWHAPISELNVLNCVVRFSDPRATISNSLRDDIGSDRFVYWLDNKILGVIDDTGEIPPWEDRFRYTEWCIGKKKNLLLNLFGDESIMFRLKRSQQRELNHWAPQMEAVLLSLQIEQSRCRNFQFQLSAQDQRNQRLQTKNSKLVNLVKNVISKLPKEMRPMFEKQLQDIFVQDFGPDDEFGRFLVEFFIGP